MCGVFAYGCVCCLYVVVWVICVFFEISVLVQMCVWFLIVLYCLCVVCLLFVIWICVLFALVVCCVSFCLCVVFVIFLMFYVLRSKQHNTQKHIKYRNQQLKHISRPSSSNGSHTSKQLQPLNNKHTTLTWQQLPKQRQPANIDQ